MSQEYLELLHTNVCEPFNDQVREGYEYFVIFTNDYSRYGYVYLMCRKSDVLDKFKEFNTKLENQLSKHLKALQFDQGFLKVHEITPQLSALGTLKQNGVAKRRNQTLMDMMRSFVNTSYFLLRICLGNCMIFS